MLRLNHKLIRKLLLCGRTDFFSSYPPHKVIGMPALSPTMESGVIAKWMVKEGDVVAPGGAIASIETDKASMVYEAVDEVVIAKILAKEGMDYPVGSPIFVSVEDSSSVSSFSNFTPVAATAPPAAPVAQPVVKSPEVLSSKNTPTPIISPIPTPVKTVLPVTPVAPVIPSVPTVAQVTSPTTPINSALKSSYIVWGTTSQKSALASLIAINQENYVKKYGYTGHIPLKP